MSLISLRYANDMPLIYTLDIPLIDPWFTLGIPLIYPWYTLDIAWWYAQDLTKSQKDDLMSHSPYPEHTLNILWTNSEYTLNILWTYSEDSLKICPWFDKISKTLLTDSVTDSPTWIQELLAHLKIAWSPKISSILNECYLWPSKILVFIGILGSSIPFPRIGSTRKTLYKQISGFGCATSTRYKTLDVIQMQDIVKNWISSTYDVKRDQL